ncbi:hypothetical protein [Flavobacterium fragile]|nr:hypothetical protein [Flavobacterium sp. HXWNR69]
MPKKMQAYNKSELENYFLAEEAKKLYLKKFLSKEQLQNIYAQLVQLKSNANFFFRIGFFFLGSFLISTIISAFGLILFPLISEEYQIIFFFYAIVAYIGLEVLVNMKFFRHGLDDAFLLTSQISFAIGIGILTEAILPVLITMLVLGVFFAIRFINTISALLAFIGLVGIFFNLIVEHDIMPKFYLSFVGLILAILVYFFVVHLAKNQNYYPYFKTFDTIRIVSLLLGYLSMNYLVVRELSQSLMNLEITNKSDVPLAFVFYGLTFLIPLLYFFLGIQWKDKLVLYTAFATLAFGFYSIRHYYYFFPIEYVMVISGILLFGLAYLIIQQLKNKTEGITFQPDRDSDNSLLFNAQAVLSLANANTPAPIQSNPMEFGGGGFSGGGAGEKF